MTEFLLSDIEKYRYKYVSNIEQSVVLEMIFPKVLEEWKISEPKNAPIPDMLETICGVTSGLFTYAISSMDIDKIKGTVSLEDVKNNKKGVYQIDLFPENDHSFILIVDNDISTIIQSYSMVYRTRIDKYKTSELMFMLENLPIYYNKLFFVDKKYVSDYDVMITPLVIRGNPIANLANMPQDERWPDYTNNILKKYGYKISNDKLIRIG